MGNLQLTDERYGGNVFIAIIHQRHLALEVTDVVLQILPWLHPHCEEMVTISLELSSRSELVVKDVSYTFKVSEGVL